MSRVLSVSLHTQSIIIIHTSILYTYYITLYHNYMSLDVDVDVCVCVCVCKFLFAMLARM